LEYYTVRDFEFTAKVIESRMITEKYIFHCLIAP